MAFTHQVVAGHKKDQTRASFRLHTMSSGIPSPSRPPLLPPITTTHRYSSFQAAYEAIHLFFQHLPCTLGGSESHATWLEVFMLIEWTRKVKLCPRDVHHDCTLYLQILYRLPGLAIALCPSSCTLDVSPTRLRTQRTAGCSMPVH